MGKLVETLVCANAGSDWEFEYRLHFHIFHSAKHFCDLEISTEIFPGILDFFMYKI